MRILSHKNIALHSRTFPGGLVTVLPNFNVDVPDDVIEHPAFKWLVDDGTVKVLVGPTEEHLEESEEAAKTAFDNSLKGKDDDEVQQAIKKSSGDGFDAGDWTAAGISKDGYPVPKGSEEDVSSKKEDKKEK